MHVADAGDGEPLLLLHGFPQHWWEWRQQIPAFAQRYRAYSIRNRFGSGRRVVSRFESATVVS